ncbi:MAG TPA: hypothetical protein VFE78_04485, partial [Gemmataceae bacterium]|nr:hypothetical protein [Gemmataceae bacterium]
APESDTGPDLGNGRGRRGPGHARQRQRAWPTACPAHERGDLPPDAAAALDYLRALWGNAPDGYLLLWVPAGRRSLWFPSADLDAIARAAVSMAATTDVYLGCALSPRDYGPKQRCKAGEVLALPGLWADIDVKGPAHKKEGLPPDTDSAALLAQSMPLPPSLFVFSGHGLYPWWLFEGAWLLDSDEARAQAADLAQRWQGRLARLAAERGWPGLDNTSDLSRVLRPPGTVNRKLGPVPVTFTLPADLRRYRPAEMLDALPPPNKAAAPAPPTATESARTAGRPDARDRAVAYLAKCPPAVSGQGGHNQTMDVTRAVVYGFDLGPDAGFDLLRQHYNPRCQPEWSEKELRHKCAEADSRPYGKPRGWLLGEERSVRGATKRAGKAHEPSGSGNSSPPELRNFFVETSTADDGKGRKAKVGLPPCRISDDLMKITGGWPKRVGGRLFSADDSCRPLWLEDAPGLFAYAASRLPGDGHSKVRWAGGEDKVSQGLFFAYLQQAAEAFDALETMPHEPPLPRIYYMHPPPAGGDGRALARLLGQFQPASLADAELIKAAALTLFWGGPPGQRPAFLIDSEPDDPKKGRGVGKTRLAIMLSRLAGGHVAVRPQDDINKIVTRLLSPSAHEKRVALLDNVKTLRFSWADLEGLITESVISGHDMYVGEGQRPNLLTWFITLNGASLSKDMAQRVVPIQMGRPSYDATWEQATTELIDRERWAIIGDILAELRRPAPPLAQYSRWSAWERDVLSRVDKPDVCQQLIAQRQGQIDDDQAEANLVRQQFIAELKARRHNPERSAVWIPARVAQAILNKATDSTYAINRAGVYLGTLSIPELRRSDRSHGNGWAWRGSKSKPNAPLSQIKEIARKPSP